MTDEGGPCFELMAGVYTDNQPDFTYLLPYETKTFSQFWWSYKNLGPVQNANKDLAIILEIQQGNKLDLGVASCRKFKNIRIILQIGNQKKVYEKLNVSPDNPWTEKTVSIEGWQENSVSLIVVDENGKELISFHRREINTQRNRKVAFEPKQPENIESTNELEFIGEHLELYRHPTRYPEPYWKEAIKRDPKSYKSYIALGRVELKNGKFDVAEENFKLAIDIMTTYHPNPALGEAYYFCGVACSFQNKLDEAYALFYKSTWNFEWLSAAYYHLATLDCLKSDYETAREHVEASLDTNRQNNKEIMLKTIIQKEKVRKT